MRRLSLRLQVEKNPDYAISDNAPSSALLGPKNDLPSLVIRRTINSKSPTVTDSPLHGPAAIPESISILSIRNAEGNPLTEVMSLSPTEILPEQCAKSENPSVTYFFERAFAASKNQELQTAIKMYRKVLACEHNHFESWINIGICQMKLSLHSEAITSFDNAIKANKLNFIPYYNKALTFIGIHDYFSALQCMDSALPHFPTPPPELMKIRTYSIFKSGKVSSAISNGEGKESPVSLRLGQTTVSPPQDIVCERPVVSPRRYTVQLDKNKDLKGLLTEKHGLPFYTQFKEIKDVDTREIKTAFTMPKKIHSDNFSHSMSPVKSKKTSKFYDWKKFLPQDFFKPKHSLPFKISDLETKEKSVKDPQILKKIREKLSQMEEKLIEYSVRRIQKSFTEPFCVNKSQLTETEVLNTLKLFDPEIKNPQEIDSFFKLLDFFAEFPEIYRYKIYMMSTIVKFEKNDTIFTQGEYAENIYLLLRGKVLSIVDSEKADTNSTSEYMKYSRMMSGDNRKVIKIDYMANCTAEEKTYTIMIPTKSFQLLLAELLRNDIEDRVCFMINLPLFKGMDPISLIPLAWNVESAIYTEGEVLVKKHDQPRGLVLIFSGYCGIYTTGVRNRPRAGSEYANIKKRTPKPPSMYTGNIQNSMTSPLKTKKNRANTYKQNSLKESSNESESDTNIKIPNFDSFMLKDYEKIEHGLLRYGDYFGGRVLMDQKNPDLASKFTIIAESKSVEVLIITKQSMQLLQEKLAAHLKIVLQKAHDIDCPPEVNSHELDAMLNTWQKYKNNMIDTIQRKKFVESKKIEFPYLR